MIIPESVSLHEKKLRIEQIRIRLREIEDSIEIIKENFSPDCEYTRFLSMGIVKDGIYKRLEYAIQTAFDICAIINRDLRCGVPEDEEDIIEKLCTKGIIDPDFSETIKKMKSFRNILVHRYGKIDDQTGFYILKNHLGDLYDFCDQIELYIQNIQKK
jgi:uncharacterized protein YutE (UPF0331/DUF86 family)